MPARSPARGAVSAHECLRTRRAARRRRVRARRRGRRAQGKKEGPRGVCAFQRRRRASRRRQQRPSARRPAAPRGTRCCVERPGGRHALLRAMEGGRAERSSASTHRATEIESEEAMLTPACPRKSPEGAARGPGRLGPFTASTAPRAIAQLQPGAACSPSAASPIADFQVQGVGEGDARGVSVRRSRLAKNSPFLTESPGIILDRARLIPGIVGDLHAPRKTRNPEPPPARAPPSRRRPHAFQLYRQVPKSNASGSTQ